MRKLVKDARDFVGAGLVMGIGAGIVEKAGGSAAGINALSSQMPAMGNIIGGAAALNAAQGLMPKSKRRRR